MANRTVKDAHSVRGTNPQYLIEKIIRSRVYDSRYWKEECFALTAELLVDKAMELKYVGGVFGGNVRPTPFLCLLLKMLQIQPEKDIVVEFIRQEDFKYVRALGATYMRLVGSSLDCYKYLEPLYNDYRKLRRQQRDGSYVIVHMDEFIDELLREERAVDVILPRIQKREVLEETNELDPRISALEDDLDEVESIDDDDEKPPPPEPKKESSSRQHSDSNRRKEKSREHHSSKDHRDSRDYRDNRDYRDHRDKDHRDRGRDHREKDYRDNRDKDYRDRERDHRDKERDHRDKDYRDHRDRKHRDDRSHAEKRKK
ncbi:pre-mRNA-splicing factor 38A-like [Ornithodoros turicata]